MHFEERRQYLKQKKFVLHQLCHVYDRLEDTYDPGVVKEIYDEFIVIKTKSGKMPRLARKAINDGNSDVTFLHRNGSPVLVPKTIWGYKFP